MELTTYYPAPYGEYETLNTTKAASFATTMGGVSIGTGSTTTDTRLSISGGDGTNLLALPSVTFLTYREKVGPLYGFNISTDSFDNSFFLHSEEGTQHQCLYFGDALPATNMFGISTKSNAAVWEARFVINQNGNVGIGTTTPTTKLQIVGLPTYDNNTAAKNGGLTVGAFYRCPTVADNTPVCVVT
jgi:hypothetical protein